MCICISISCYILFQYEDEEKVVVYTGEYKDADIVKFIQGEQLALVTKFSDEV